jgi:hypothetical protein
VALAVGSWDHLSSKGLVKIVPDRVLVWNDVQRREAVRLHRLPSSRVVATGAQLFDQWFERSPASTRREFLERHGLGEKSYVLYVGSSPNITEPEREVRFVRRWVEALRAAGAPLDDLAVVVRPHPGNSEHWAAVDLSDAGVVILPRTRPQIPMSAADEDLYFDSIHHAVAIVGINTSAILESLIQRRPVLTIRAEEFRETQDGTIHFRYLLPESGGALQVAESIELHLEQLRRVLAHPDATRGAIDAFLRLFVRPHGLDRPATPILADAIESLGSRKGRRTIGSARSALRSVAAR